jgi:glucosamine-6-phosphate deaminase
MRLLISKHNIGKWTAHYVADKIKAFNPSADRLFVLGLPTGSTPLDMYREFLKH